MTTLYTAPVPQMPASTADAAVQEVKPKKVIKQSAGILAVNPKTKMVLLLASRKREGAWVLPKGPCMTEPQPEAPESAACRIAWETCGIRGTINKKVGTFTEAGKRGKINAYNWMYEMQVDKLEDNWPDHDRQRIWVSYEDALRATADRPISLLALKHCSLAR